VNDEQLQLLAQLGISQAELAQFETLVVAVLVAGVVALLLTPWLARRKQRNVGFWVVMVLLFGPLALLAILFVPAKKTLAEPTP
jgi:cyanate permease